jgi:hypothetical protein
MLFRRYVETTLHDRIVVGDLAAEALIRLAMTLALANAEAGLRGGNVLSLVERQTLALARLPACPVIVFYALCRRVQALPEPWRMVAFAVGELKTGACHAMYMATHRKQVSCAARRSQQN